MAIWLRYFCFIGPTIIGETKPNEMKICKYLRNGNMLMICKIGIANLQIVSIFPFRKLQISILKISSTFPFCKLQISRNEQFEKWKYAYDLQNRNL